MQHVRLLLGLAAATLVALGWLAHATCCGAGSWNEAAWPDARTRAELRSPAARAEAPAEAGSLRPAEAIHQHRAARPLTRVWWPDGVLAGTTELDPELFRSAAGPRPIEPPLAADNWQSGAGVGMESVLRPQGVRAFTVRAPAAEAGGTPFAKDAEWRTSAAARHNAGADAVSLLRATRANHRF